MRTLTNDELTINYEVEAVCEGCGEGIEECYYTNKQGQTVHMTSVTNGYYYNDGSARCEACHDANRSSW